jgi:hypothetical protein
MALDARINAFENFPLANVVSAFNAGNSIGSLLCHYVYIPGSLSFNNIAILFNGTAQAANTKSVTFSIGIYTRNGSTLSLLNSASKSNTYGPSDSLSFVTMVTSAAMDLTQGNYYLAFMSSTGGGASSAGYGLIANAFNQSIGNTTYGGPFFRGRFSVTTSSMPASIATSDMVKEGNTSTRTSHPYIIISS